MKKRGLAFILSILLLISVIPVSAKGEKEEQAAHTEDYGTPGTDYVEGEAIVCVKGGADALNKRSRDASYQVEELMDVSAASDADTPMVMSESADHSTESADREKTLVLVKSQGDVAGLIEELESSPSVEYAEPNYFLETYDEVDTPVERNSTFSSERNDPYYGYQWALKNQTDPDTEGVDANVTAAWNTAADGQEAAAPVVAVVDTGVDYNHEDLKDVMWDDGLNYPALMELGGGKYGANYAGGDTTDPLDTLEGHGTHCAGIIAAQGDNAAGVSGTAPGVEIMALRMLGEESTTDLAIKCYEYIQTAKDAGVNVTATNNSWGPTDYDGLELRSVATAVTSLGKNGIVSCFAAGNSGTDNDLNTGSISRSPYAVRVGAMESRGHAAAFSCYGESMVDIFAPGVDILSAASTDAGVEAANGISPRYLPWLMEEHTTDYFYEDFEDTDPDVTLKLFDEKGELKEEKKAAEKGAGFAGGGGIALPLDSIQEGEGFYIDMTIPKDKLVGLAENPSEQEDPVYLAFQAGCKDTVHGEYLLMQYKNKDGQWEPLSMIDNRYWAGISLDNYGYNQLTLKILKEQLSILEGDQDGNVMLRFTPSHDVDRDKRMGVMSGRGEHPVFYLDNLGFGKDLVPYAYSSGTSMAAPVVTGIAAMAAQTATETGEERAAKVCARIKGSANREGTTGLENTCVTEGMVDAGAAVSSDESVLNPVPETLDVQDATTGVLKGYFFGGGPGTLMVSKAGGEMKELTVGKWTDRELHFTLPDDFTGRYQVKVIRADEKYGRDFFLAPQASRGYTDLPAPKLSYGDFGGFEMTSADAFMSGMGAAGNTILRIAYIEELHQAVAEVYDTKEKTWSKAPLPEGMEEMSEESLGEISLSGGSSKIYIRYRSEPASQWMLGIYDTAAGTWEAVPAEFEGGETLAVYQDQLLAIGGIKQTSEDSEELELRTDIKVVDTSTGALTDSTLKLPEKEGGAAASASGSVLAVYYGKSGRTMIYDGSAWSVTEDTFFNGENEMFDEQQTLQIGCQAVNGGLIAAGPVHNLGKADMKDTWSFDIADKVWSGREDVLYHAEKTTMDMAVCLNGEFYVLSRGMLDSPLIFGALAVDYTGPAKDPEGGKDPEPTPDPGAGTGTEDQTLGRQDASGTKKAVKTGDTADVAFWVLLLAGSIVLVTAGEKRRHRNK